MTTICELCETEISKYNLIKHKKSDSCSKIHKLLLKKEKEYRIKLNNNNIQYENKEKEYLNKIKLLEEDILTYKNIKQELVTKEAQLNLLQNNYEDLRKIIEKSATKTTIKNNYNHNNYLNYISAEPIKFNEIKSQLKQIVNCETVMYDEDDFHNHIVDNILKDKNGKDKVLCTDINRKNFAYKDEKSGELVYDPELDNLRNKLRNGIKLKQVRNELLEKLKKEYEENGSLGKDPYVKFYEMIQKLNFGIPFIEHVAKKTYVKSKNNKINDNKNDCNDRNNTNDTEVTRILETQCSEPQKIKMINYIDENNEEKQYISISDISDEQIRKMFTEEEYLEYQELVKEFGKELIF